jgi:ribosomal protein S7
MDLVESRTSQPGGNVFKQALANLKPVVEVDGNLTAWAMSGLRPTDAREKQTSCAQVRTIALLGCASPL